MAVRYILRLRPSETRGLAAALLLLAGPLLAAYFFFSFVYPQAPVRMAKASAELIDDLALWSLVVDWGLPVPRSQTALAMTILAAVLVAFGLYAVAIVLTWDRLGGRVASTVVLGSAIAFFVLSACALPNSNSDIYSYIATGRVYAAHQANPYTTPVDDFPEDSAYPFTDKHYTDDPGDNKPVAWSLVAIGLAKIGGQDVATSVMVFRTAFLLANCACLALIALLLKFLAPQRQLAGTVAYGWNPIVVTQGESKVDIVMVLFLLIATVLILRRHPGPAAAAFAISALVKLITLPLIAVWWLGILRRRRPWESLGTAAVMAVTAAVVVIPFWHGPDVIWQQIDLLWREGQSVPSMLYPFVTLAFVTLLLVLGLRRHDGHRLIRAWALVALFFALFLTRFEYSWYLITVIAIVSLQAEWLMLILAGAVSLASLFLNEWKSVSSGPFPLLGLANVPTSVLYLVPPGLAVIAGLLYARQSGWRGRNRLG